MRALEEARTILNRRVLATDALYKEHQLEKAQALATLAVAEALEGLGQPAKPQEVPESAYALTRRLADDAKAEVHSIYLNQQAAIVEADSLNTMAKIQGVDVRWGVSPYTLKGN